VIEHAPEPRPVGELVVELADQTRTLIKTELLLARTEMSAKAKTVTRQGIGVAIGLGVAAGGALALLAGVILLVGEIMALWAAALLVGALVAAGGAALTASKLRLLKRLDLAPRQTLQTLEENKLWLRNQASQ